MSTEAGEVQTYSRLDYNVDKDFIPVAYLTKICRQKNE